MFRSITQWMSVSALVLVAECAVAARPAFHDQVRVNDPATVDLGGCIDQADGELRCAFLAVQYVGDPDGLFGYSATWLSYTENSYFADYADTRILACPINEQAYRVSARADEASLQVSLDVAHCNQTAYRYRYELDSFEPINGFTDVVSLSATMRDPAGSELRVSNGSESIGASSYRLACKTTLGWDYRDVHAVFNGVALKTLEYSYAGDKACNYTFADRSAE